MKWLSYCLLSGVVCLSSCKDPVKFTKPMAADVTRYKAVPVEGLSGSFIGQECAAFLNVGRQMVPEATDEMVLDGPEGIAVVGYLHAIERDALVITIPFRGPDGVSTRKSVTVPKRYIRELRTR